MQGKRTPKAVPQADAIGLELLDESVSFHLGRAHAALLASIGRQLAEVGILPHRIAVMTLISANPGITPRTLTQLTGRDKSTLTPILADLERRELVVRVGSRTDRRSHGLSTTEAGEAAVRLMERVVDDHEALVADVLGVAERDTLLRHLKLLTRRLTRP